MLPMLKTQDFIDLDCRIDFSTFSAQEVQVLIELLTSGSINSISTFTINLMVMLFCFTSILIVV